MLASVVVAFSACTNAWEDHTKINENVSTETMLDYLETQTDLSQFVALLKETGYDTNLASAGIYTVWAPTNQALSAVDPNLLASAEKKALFVAHHLTAGKYSSLNDDPSVLLKMRSGKMINFDASANQIDDQSIDTSKEKTVKNGVVQVLNAAISPRYSIWDYLMYEAPERKFVSFLKSLNTTVFDEENSVQIGVNAQGRPIYDSLFVVRNQFVDAINLGSEDSVLTLIVPSDAIFDAEFSKFEKYYRRDDKVSNVNPTARDSVYIQLMLARDMVFEGLQSNTSGPDTLVSYFSVRVPFKKAAITSKFEASNGVIYFSTDCGVVVSHKILLIKMEAEQTYLSMDMTTGTPQYFVRERANASGGYDLVVDNSHNSQALQGVLFAGPVVSSIKYRVKIRAINDFRKSYRNPDSAIELRQWLGQVTITRNPLTNEVTAISPTTNAFNSGTAYGTPDVTYDTTDPSTFYVPYASTAYGPVADAQADEIDLGYFEFAKADQVVLRLIPQVSKMAVTADYFRLVPIIE